jgi:hypothetical protein
MKTPDDKTCRCGEAMAFVACWDNAQETDRDHAWNLYTCAACGRICKVDVWTGAGELWIEVAPTEGPWGFGEARHALHCGDRTVFDAFRDIGISDEDVGYIEAVLNSCSRSSDSGLNPQRALVHRARDQFNALNAPRALEAIADLRTRIVTVTYSHWLPLALTAEVEGNAKERVGYGKLAPAELAALVAEINSELRRLYEDGSLYEDGERGWTWETSVPGPLSPIGLAASIGEAFGLRDIEIQRTAPGCLAITAAGDEACVSREDDVALWISDRIPGLRSIRVRLNLPD